ncbi:MAG: hypothetical protein AABZ45_05770 [Pseudomonadota bacterium]
MTNTLNNVIRFEEVASQTTGDITRVIGFVPSRHVFALFDNPAIDANPRRPKVNKVTADILNTLNASPDLFHFKSKGVLLGTSSYEALQRNRYQLNFSDPTSEGILDGGHNMLSIGLFFLSKVMDEKNWKKIKEWDEMLEAWNDNRSELNNIRDTENFLIPVELLIPSKSEDDTVARFKIAIIDICASRNNNAQLAQEAKANQRGLYDEIKLRFEHAEDDLANRVEWKTNEWDADTKRSIKVRDLVALAWLPLNVLAEDGFLDGQHRVNPVQIYSGKGACSVAYERLYEDERVSMRTTVGKYELKSTAIGSALDILVDLPWLFDWIVESLPEAYNKNNGKFGRIDAVKMGSFLTPFYENEVEYKVPDGFAVPLFYGLTALMKVNNKSVTWITDPEAFLDKHFKDIVGGYKMALEMAQFDPQKVAKSEHTYNLAVSQFKFAMMSDGLLKA